VVKAWQKSGNATSGAVSQSMILNKMISEQGLTIFEF